MATIFIKDTGYIKPGEETGSKETNIVNGGTELPLKGVTINYGRGISFDNKPTPGGYDEVRLNYVSLTNPTITISGQIKPTGDLSNVTEVNNTLRQIGGITAITDQDSSSSTAEIDILYLLDNLVRTKGYKELYFKGNPNAVDGDGASTEILTTSLLYGLGSTDTYNSTYRHLHVLCKGIRITQNATSTLITWTLTCEVTKGE